MLKTLCYLAQNMLPVVTDWFGHKAHWDLFDGQREGNDVKVTTDPLV